MIEQYDDAKLAQLERSTEAIGAAADGLTCDLMRACFAEGVKEFVQTHDHCKQRPNGWKVINMGADHD